MLIFVYGTLMSGYHNNPTIAKHGKIVARGTTIDNFNMYAVGIPFMVEEPVRKITGEVWEIDQEGLRKADSLEGHPHLYKRTPIKVECEDGEIRDCETYIYQHEPSGTEIKDGNYRSYAEEVRYDFI